MEIKEFKKVEEEMTRSLYWVIVLYKTDLYFLIDTKIDFIFVFLFGLKYIKMPYYNLPCCGFKVWNKRNTFKLGSCYYCKNEYCILETGVIRMNPENVKCLSNCRHFETKYLIPLCWIYLIICAIYTLVRFCKTGENSFKSKDQDYELGWLSVIAVIFFLPCIPLSHYMKRKIEEREQREDEQALLGHVEV